MSSNIQPTTPPSQTLPLPSSPSSSSLHYFCYLGVNISDELLEQCAKLFGENYGVWGENPTATKRDPKPGSRVKMSGTRLRKQCVGTPEQTVLVACFLTPNTPIPASVQQMRLVGHAFATVWDYDGGSVGWVTQLVVSIQQRKRYIETSLLQSLKDFPIFKGITVIGLVSSHPAACGALGKYSGTSICSVDTHFCQRFAKSIIKNSPVDYVREMKLCGSLFDANCKTGVVSAVFTSFYVDHTEPLEALAEYRENGPWPLGELLEGHEFLVILQISNH